MTKNTKRITLGTLAVVAAVAIPVATVVSCGKSEKKREVDTWGWSKKVPVLKLKKVDRVSTYTLDKDTRKSNVTKQTEGNLLQFVKSLLTKQEFDHYLDVNTASNSGPYPAGADLALLIEVTNESVYKIREMYEEMLIPLNKAVKTDVANFTYTTTAKKKIVAKIDLTDDTTKLLKNMDNLLVAINSYEKSFKDDPEDSDFLDEILQYIYKTLEYELAVANKFAKTPVMKEMMKETGNSQDEILNELFSYDDLKDYIQKADMNISSY